MNLHEIRTPRLGLGARVMLPIEIWGDRTSPGTILREDNTYWYVKPDLPVRTGFGGFLLAEKTPTNTGPQVVPL